MTPHLPPMLAANLPALAIIAAALYVGYLLWVAHRAPTWDEPDAIGPAEWEWLKSLPVEDAAYEIAFRRIAAAETWERAL